MPLLSVIIITKNEEQNLRRALESAKFADEIIINDSGSADATLDIAREFNCKIIKTEFRGFGAAKQATLEQATGEWVLSIDADEEIDATMRESLKKAVSQSNGDGYFVSRKSQFLGRWMLHSGWYPDYILRLFRRSSGRFTDDWVHEKVEVNGSIGRLEGHLLHYTNPNLSQYLSKLNRYTSLSARQLSKRGARFHVYFLLAKPTATFFSIYILKRGFLDGVQGLILALLSAFHTLCKYVKLWELEKS